LLSEKQYDKNVDSHASSKINRDIWIDYSKNNLVIFIKTIYDDKIEELYIFNTKSGRKIFAQNASIKKTTWVLKNVTIVDNEQIKNTDTLEISSDISLDLIKLLSKPPEKHDIYRLYKIYKIQKKDKVVLRLYELELHKLLSNCYNFLLFALIAAVICFPINRYKTKTSIAIKVISTAILMRFSNDMFKSLAHGEIIPVQFACWVVLLTLTCVFVAILIWREA
jgi:lipopolysaccharide export LptBFGC system permease protein LptF